MDYWQLPSSTSLLPRIGREKELYHGGEGVFCQSDCDRALIFTGERCLVSSAFQSGLRLSALLGW